MTHSSTFEQGQGSLKEELSEDQTGAFLCRRLWSGFEVQLRLGHVEKGPA